VVSFEKTNPISGGANRHPTKTILNEKENILFIMLSGLVIYQNKAKSPISDRKP
jgi:hypothetical protein